MYQWPSIRLAASSSLRGLLKVFVTLPGSIRAIFSRRLEAFSFPQF
jgi:hypothetical protein